jgi:hypothetical protein
MGIGFIVRDSTRKQVVAANQFISASPDLVVSEAIAALRAVEFSQKRGLAIRQLIHLQKRDSQS